MPSGSLELHGSAEPRRRGERPLAFVVQKHQATTLHFDLRIQIGDTMKSWAVPKGPSLDPRVRRLAVEVEDHPLAYNDFEGTIPDASYGAGTVMLWDRGRVRANTFSGAGESDALRRGYEAGKLDVTLEGERLRGAFTLLRSRGGTGRRAQWFLVKQQDEHARPGSDLAAQETTSIATGRTMEEIAAADGRPVKARATRATHAGGTAKKAAAREVAPRRRSLSAATLEPMYATIGTEVPRGPGWTFEPKYDGVRVLAHVSRRSVKLVTRNLKDKSKQFPEVVRALKRLAERADRVLILDGEIVALDAGEPARFQALQSRMHLKNAKEIARQSEEAPAALVAFDILRDGEDVLLDEPWSDRRRRLAQRLRGVAKRPSAARRKTKRVAGAPAEGEIRLGETAAGDGEALLAEARAAGWEGIIAKRTDAVYRPGKRSEDWLKLKVEFRQEFVVGGWTEPRNSREHIGALLLGYFEGDRLVYVGHTGGGFTREGLAEMHRRLQPLERKTAPFAEPPQTNEPAHWASPKVVVEVKFSEWTADGRLRQPIYVGTRDDKDARDVTLEGTSVQRASRGGRGAGDQEEDGDGE